MLVRSCLAIYHLSVDSDRNVILVRDVLNIGDWTRAEFAIEFVSEHSIQTTAMLLTMMSEAVKAQW
jgi:predicted transport protein